MSFIYRSIFPGYIALLLSSCGLLLHFSVQISTRLPFFRHLVLHFHNWFIMTCLKLCFYAFALTVGWTEFLSWESTTGWHIGCKMHVFFPGYCNQNIACVHCTLEAKNGITFHICDYCEFHYCLAAWHYQASAALSMWYIAQHVQWLIFISLLVGWVSDSWMCCQVLKYWTSWFSCIISEA